MNLNTDQKTKLCQQCPKRRNYFCTKHVDEWQRVVKQRSTCEGWGNEPPKVSKVRLGFCIPQMAMGGVTRNFITMMNAPVNHSIEWSGIAITNADGFDIESAKQLLKHCPVYCSKDNPRFKGLVTIVPNACQTVVETSDVVNLWGFNQPHEEVDSVNWNQTPILVIAHGQCAWTRKGLAVSLSKGSKHILTSVSAGGIDFYPESVRGRVKVIYNGADFSRCAPSRDREEVRHEWGVKPCVKAIGYIGRFAEDKNPLAAAKAVAELGEGYHAVYAGDGHQRGKITEEVQRLCGDRSTILDSTGDVGTILNALDCIVMASPSEGGPNTAIEAWLASCPVVSTPVGMIPELEAEHGPLVYGVPVDPPRRELADVVSEALNFDDRVGRARRLAWNQLSPSRMISGYERAILDSLKSKPCPPKSNAEPSWRSYAYQSSY